MKTDMKDEQINNMAKLLKSMAHPIRFKILCLLQHEEVSVGDLRDHISTSRANISGHLNILRNQGVIDFRKDSNVIYNKITDDRIHQLLAKLNDLFYPVN